jgi:hypothetical protein
MFIFTMAPAAAQTEAAPPPQESDADFQAERLLDLGGYAGFNLRPGNAAIGLSGDLHLSQYLSIGPLAQVSFWNTRTFILFTGGGKFHFPIEFIPGLELNVQAGTGYFFRRAGGFNFHNFVFIAGPGFDYFVARQWALSAMGLINVSNDRVDDYFYTGLFGVKFIL